MIWNYTIYFVPLQQIWAESLLQALVQVARRTSWSFLPIFLRIYALFSFMILLF